MPRILLSLALIAATGAAVFIGGTGAFFSDTERSSANTFTAGAIDLKIDNESYYNGFLNEETSWTLADLTIEKFFDFDDVKPSDYGEDTISIHVDDNDAYLCASVTLTSNDDNSCTEPELLDDVSCVAPGEGEGDLADLMNFIWWADDGDNVLEDDENVISQGPIGALTLDEPHTLALADVTTNIWNEGNAAGPVPGATTKYIGKAWCFGTLTPAPLPQDGQVDAWSPADDNNDNQEAGEPADGGFVCDGSGLDNGSQTDSLTADVTFSAIQSRHNNDFRCVPDVPVEFTTLTLVKVVVNDDLGDAEPTAWMLLADGPTDLTGVTGSAAVTNAPVLPGVYNLSEALGAPGYTGSAYSCVVNGGAPVVGNQVTIAEGDTVVCTVTNDDNEPVACIPEQSYADTVVAFDQGVRKNGTAINADRTDPTKALGAPQSSGTPFDNPVVAGSFFSLGFDEGTDNTPNEGGWITVAFGDNYIVNGPGNDLRMWEVTGGTSYPVEKLKVEVSQDGVIWHTAAASALRDAEADLASTPLPWAKYVRLTDVSVRSEFEDTADGYDLDAFSALNCETVPNVPSVAVAIQPE